MCYTYCNREENLEQVLFKFSEDETVVQIKLYTEDENNCENHFKSIFKRHSNDGRFVVELPFQHQDQIGNSYGLATSRLKKLENRFKRDPSFKEY